MARHVLTVALGLLLVAGAGCGKHKYSAGDLELELTRYHTNLRWDRLGVAAQHVHPELQHAFAVEWQKRSELVQLQLVEVVHTTFPDEDTALVQVKVEYFTKRTMRLKKTVIEEKWVRTEHGWFLMSVPEIPPPDEQ